MKALILNWWIWWISENLLISSSESFVYAANIDFHRNAGALSLSAQNTNFFTTDWLINACAWPYYFTDTGKIYYDNGSLRYTMTNYPTIIYNATYFHGAYYWASNSALHKVLLSGAATTPWTNVQENYAMLENAICYPMLNYYDQILYIWAGNKLQAVDKDGNFSTTLTLWGNITWITLFAGNLRVYTDEISWWKLYYVRPVIEEAYSVVDFKDLDFRTVINDGSTDYALAWNISNLKTSSLVAVSGYSSAIIKKAITRDDLFQFVWNTTWWETNCMTKYKDMIYLPSKQWIYSFGNFNPSFDKIFNLDYAISNDSIWLLKAESEKLYLSYVVGSTNYFDKIEIWDSISTYMTSGEAISHIYNWWSFTESKKIEKISLGFEKLVPWQKIEIFIKKDWQTEWGSALATVDYSNTNDREIYFKTFIWPNIDIWPWNFLQIKIKLTAWTSNLTSPKLYELFLWFDLQTSSV